MGIFRGTGLYMKNIIRSKLSLILFVLIGYDCLVLSTVAKGMQSYGIVVMRTYLFQGIMLLMIFLGYSLAKEERDIGCEEIFLSLKNGKEKIFGAKILVGVVFIFIITTYFLISQMCFVFKDEGAKTIVWDIILSNIAYITMPLLVIYLIGLIIGSKVKGYKGYGIVFFIWIITSSLNHLIIGVVETYIDKNLSTEAWLLTLGVKNTSLSMYEGIKGLTIEPFIWGKMIIWLMIMVLFIAVLFYRKFKKYSITVVMGAIGIIGLCSYEIYENKISVAMDSDRTYLGDIAERAVGASNLVSEENIYKVMGYEGEITPNDVTKFKIDIELRLNEDSEILYFTFNKDFNIKEIKSEDGEKLTFEKEDYLLKVKLGETKKKDSVVKLDFDYSGKIVGSKYFSNKDAINMPPEYLWLPLQNLGKVIVVNEAGDYQWNNLNTEANYRIKVNSNEKVYSNLNRIGENTFEGNKEEGIYILSTEEFDTRNIEDVEFYYPRAYKEMYDFEGNYENLKLVEKAFESLLDKEFNFNKVYLLSLFSQNGFYYEGESCVFDSNGVNTLDAIRKVLITEEVTEEGRVIFNVILEPMIDENFFKAKDRLEDFGRDRDWLMLDEMLGTNKQVALEKSILEKIKENKILKEELIKRIYKMLKEGGNLTDLEMLLDNI